jgi:hypothetical protein
MTSADTPRTPDGRLPIGSPLGTTPEPANTQVSDRSDEIRETNTSLIASSTPARLGRVGKRRLERLSKLLSERDLLLLRVLAQHRYLTAHHIQLFMFRDHASIDSAARTTRRVLARLERDGLLRALQRRIGGVRAGSSSTIWQLSPAGARLLRSDGSGYRTHEPSLRFLQHCLVVADVHLALNDLSWTGLAEDVRVDVEPDCWRRYSGPGGEPRWLQPDLYTRILTAAYDDRWFVEVDLGTESLPTLLRKCAGYEAYRAAGQEQSNVGVFPLVLWVFTEPKRGQRLQRAIASSRTLTPQLYRMSTVDQVAATVRGATS